MADQRPDPGSRARPPTDGRLAVQAGRAALLGLVVLLATTTAALSCSSRTEPAPAPPAPPPAPAVAGVTATEVVFGMASPFTGANKELGRGMKAGIELAFAAANEAGGVHGRKLRLVALDDGYEPDRTLGVMKELVEERKVFGIVGNVGSVTAGVSIPYVTEKKVLFLGALSGAPVLRKTPPDRYVFNFRPSYAEETAAAVRYLMDVLRLPASAIAVFHQDDPFGQAGLAGVQQQLKRAGGDPAKLLALTYRRNSSEVADAVARLAKAADVRAVVMVATYKAAAQFIVAARDAVERPLTFTNVSPVDSNALADDLLQAGTRYTEGVVVTQIVPLPTSRATAVTRYRGLLERHALGERPGFLTLESFVVGEILVEALRRAGPALDTEKLVATLEGIRDLDLGIGTKISFGPAEHQGSHKVWGTALQPDGAYAALDLE
ncbi:MAG: ABC transporter substrate-binding protein [Anaeromyxobacter sp.]|nr:ABC transporter substrate-binding protein [Anaeromyxobacter sp.]MBL0274656.1 ABC transporter substrate-binding protein [Anaeromyxobacter sp.]